MATQTIVRYLLLEGLGHARTEDGQNIILSAVTLSDLIDIIVSDRNNTPSVEVSDRAANTIVNSQEISTTIIVSDFN